MPVLAGLPRRYQSPSSLRAVVPLLLATLASLPACAARAPATVSTPSGLTYRVLARGSGPRAVPGDLVTIDETTRFADGRVHFTTAGRTPIRFLLGGRQVIDGLDEGVTGMQVGERRALVVPPGLSRRSSYPPDLDPQAVLHYEVTVVRIEPGARP